jgi:hypothetical protein
MMNATERLEKVRKTLRDEKTSLRGAFGGNKKTHMDIATAWMRKRNVDTPLKSAIERIMKADDRVTRLLGWTPLCQIPRKSQDTYLEYFRADYQDLAELLTEHTASRLACYHSAQWVKDLYATHIEHKHVNHSDLQRCIYANLKDPRSAILRYERDIDALIERYADNPYTTEGKLRHVAKTHTTDPFGFVEKVVGISEVLIEEHAEDSRITPGIIIRYAFNNPETAPEDCREHCDRFDALKQIFDEDDWVTGGIIKYYLSMHSDPLKGLRGYKQRIEELLRSHENEPGMTKDMMMHIARSNPKTPHKAVESFVDNRTELREAYRENKWVTQTVIDYCARFADPERELKQYLQRIWVLNNRFGEKSGVMAFVVIRIALRNKQTYEQAMKRYLNIFSTLKSVHGNEHPDSTIAKAALFHPNDPEGGLKKIA